MKKKDGGKCAQRPASHYAVAAEDLLKGHQRNLRKVLEEETTGCETVIKEFKMISRRYQVRVVLMAVGEVRLNAVTAGINSP